MNALIVLAHPEAHSFNSELVRRGAQILKSQGHAVQVSDLYARAFDPAEHPRHFHPRNNADRFYAQTEQRFSGEQGTLPEDVRREMDELLWADFVLFQFPLWWFGMPAILKGWMDRVFVYGTLYSGSRRFHNGVCRGKRAMLSVTAGSPAEACEHDGREGDTRLMLWPTHYALHYVGFEVLEPLILTGIGEARGAADQALHDRLLNAQLERHAMQLAQLDATPLIRFNVEDDWDEYRKLKSGAPVYSPFIRHSSKLHLDDVAKRGDDAWRNCLDF